MNTYQEQEQDIQTYKLLLSYKEQEELEIRARKAHQS
jgi:hypothetical protein